MPKPTKPGKLTHNEQQGAGPIHGAHSSTPVTSAYEESQQDEVDVLKAIYDDKFSDVKSKAAWSKSTEKSFRLKLTAYSNEDVSVVLQATLTATYPKTLPILSVSESYHVTDECLAHVRGIIAKKPRQLLGEVMIHEIATAIQDALEDSASAQAQRQAQSAQVPSLEEERAVQEANLARIASEQEEVAARREAAVQAENERKVRELLDEKQRLVDQKRTKSEVTDEILEETPVSTVSFTPHIKFRDEYGQGQIFRTVTLLPSPSRGLVSTLSYAVPFSTDLSAQPLILALKQFAFPHSRSKSSMLELESLLEKLKGMHHTNLINLLGFRIDDALDSWNFHILIERASRGSLVDLLIEIDTLPTNKVRLWGIELLQGLDFLHRNGVVHGRLHAGNVLLHRLPNGVSVPKVSDGGFEVYLHDLAPKSKAQDLATFPRWLAPEVCDADNPERSSRKTDMWNFGVIVVQMLVGISVCENYPTPESFRRSSELSEPFDDLLRDLLHREAKARPNAFDVIPYEFFRVDAPAMQATSLLPGSNKPSKTSSMPAPRRLRHESIGAQVLSSRYGADWDEISRLGKGGYGEVVKSRNKLDGRVYAIKKITHNTPTQLSQVLSEVYLLATLNHPYVVRYYTAWPEDEAERTDESSEDLRSSSGATFTGGIGEDPSFSLGQSARGLDFISSSGYPKIEFGYDDDDEEAVSDEESTSEDEESSSIPSAPGKVRKEEVKLPVRARGYSSRTATRSTLYIQMELCERLTLRDVIRKGLPKDSEEIWRLFRAILEGLVHIHSHGIIHRDLKPENVFIDAANNPRIGDFGLATSGHFARPDRVAQSQDHDGDMTHNVGTTLYVAPELQTHETGNYSEKIDMYSLGIIFFEMCFTLGTGMERMHVLNDMRQKDFILPSSFANPDKALQGDIIQSLLSHRPSARPNSAELLRSGKLPLQVEDETVLLALKGLADDSNPYHHKMMTALFAKGPDRNVRAQMWDLSDKEASQSPSVVFSLLQSMVKEKLTACFRRHGAVETSRQGPIPRSEYYENKNAFQMLDSSGTLVQLPYDFTLPLARKIARHANVPEKSFAFGTVWRDSLNNGAPRSNREVDFDIVTRDAKDNVLKEAEVIKVMDELLDEIPALSSAPMCYHISHSELLNQILSFCRIGHAQQAIVKETLARLNIQGWGWQKIRIELRGASVGIPSTSIDELAQFDFRDTPEKTLKRLQHVFAGTNELSCLHEIFMHISGLVEFCKRLGIRRKIYISPLSSFNDRFYLGGIMFQCLFDAKKRDVLAAGGRYDSLIAAHRSYGTGQDQASTAHAVGINIAWDRIVSSMVRYQAKPGSGSNFLKKGEEEPPKAWPVRRCDVLISSFDPSVLRSTGVRLVAELWAHDISAELAGDANAPEELLSRHRSDNHSWIIQIKHDSSGTANMSARSDLKVKSLDKKEDFDVRSSELIPFLRAEMRERDQREGTQERTRLARQQNQADSTTSSSAGAGVSVLVSAHKSKKSNKMRIVESARVAAQGLLNQSAGAPIAAIETRDEILDKIRETRLSDAESWRRVIQEVPLSERLYIREVQEEIERLKETHGESSRNCFVYNFRTGSCVLYDMRL